MDKTLEYIKSGRGLPPKVGNSTEKRKNKVQSCEEYVLLELDRAKAQIKELEKTNKELKCTIKEMKEKPQEPTNMKCIYLEDTPNYYYQICGQSEYEWNKILIQNDETPELVEKALTDDEALEKLCSLQKKEYYWGRGKIGEVREGIYNYRFKLRNDKEILIVLYENDYSVYTLGDRFFLDKDVALAAMYAERRKEINHYLNSYKEKFEEEKVKNE